MSSSTASTCEEIICSQNCEQEMPEVSFNICSPEVNYGQLAKFYATNVGYPLTSENDPVEWENRKSASGPSKIIEMSIIGDKPLATANEVAISRGRTAVGARDHSINLKVDETNQTNYEMMRSFECGKTVLGWYETYAGLLYGGASGIQGTLNLGEVIPEGTADVITFQGTFKWKAKHSPCRTISPIAG